MTMSLRALFSAGEFPLIIAAPAIAANGLQFAYPADWAWPLSCPWCHRHYHVVLGVQEDRSVRAGVYCQCGADQILGPGTGAAAPVLVGCGIRHGHAATRRYLPITGDQWRKRQCRPQIRGRVYPDASGG